MAEHADILQGTLANGIQLIQMPMPGRLASAVIIALPAGARHEQPREIGVAHMLEHMAFKGTERYPSATELNHAAAYLGTELNGLTTNDYVEFSAMVRAESTMATLDLLSEICGRPLLAEEHLQAERAVILQELADANEDPAARADDQLLAALFPDQRLGLNVAGKASDVQRLSHAQALDFRERQWSPEGGVVVLAGNLDHIDKPLLEQQLMRIPARESPPPPLPPGPFRQAAAVEERDGDVVHLRLAYSIGELDISQRHNRATAEVYSDLLGGPAGSRLFDELREQRGLCYWIDGFVWGCDSAAFLSVDCSVRADDLSETCERIDAIVADLRERGPTDEECARACSYALGSAALGFESTGACADHAVELVMEYGDHAVDPLVYLQALQVVKRESIAALAASVQPGPCVGCVGPVSAADLPLVA